MIIFFWGEEEMIEERWYSLDEIPDLSLNKYASFDDGSVDGILSKHLAFLRQLNRKGILSRITIHLFYRYRSKNKIGDKLEILLMFKGDPENLRNMDSLIDASPLSDYYQFQKISIESLGFDPSVKQFTVCSTLIKKEIFVKPLIENRLDQEEYYTVSKWEVNEEGRLYNMFKLLESLKEDILYRVDLIPVEKNESLRLALRKPIAVLRDKQLLRTGSGSQRDIEAEQVLRSYDELQEKFDTSPHFYMNVFVFGNNKQNTSAILDSSGSEALKKGNYILGHFNGDFSYRSFLLKEESELDMIDRDNRLIMQRSTNPDCMIICHMNAKDYTLKYLPNLYTLEEIAPFFRLPALYDGENIQKRKETSPIQIDSKGAIYLGKDTHGYDVNFPLINLAKHAFIAGVPGSGKTNAMYHITSSLWSPSSSRDRIPFLVFEPAKQEYRALLNHPDMDDIYFFSPNANMKFPLHINPFEFPKGLMVAEHIRKLVSVFIGAFPLENPMPFLLDTAIEAVYRQMGWDPSMVYTDDVKLKFPTMSMLYKRLEEELRITQYSSELKGNLESALKVRIGSLLLREMGSVFDVQTSTIAPERWLKIPAIIELESMGSGPANFLTLMLCTLIRESLKVQPGFEKNHVRHVIFIEEAHNLIGSESEETYGAEANPKQAATSFIVKMLAEVRALKEGIVIADQLPTAMAEEVIKNTGLKIGLRITAADDRSLMGSTMAANGFQMEQMAVFNPGEALIGYEGLKRPFKFKVHEWCSDLSKQERQQITTPKSDEALLESMKARQTYQEVAIKSIRIEFTRILNNYNDAYSLLELTIEHSEKIRECYEQLLHYDEVMTRLSIRMAQSNSDINDQEALDTYAFNRNKLERKLSDLKKNKLFIGLIPLINQTFEILAKFERCRSRSKKLVQTLPDSNGKFKVHPNIAAVHDEINQKTVSLLGKTFKAYSITKDHMTNTVVIDHHFKKAAERYGIRLPEERGKHGKN